MVAPLLKTENSISAFPDQEELHGIITAIADDAARRRNAADTPPRLAIDLLKRHRIGAARLPRELGGGGFTVRQLLDLLIELGTADPDVPHITRIHFQFVEHLIVATGRGQSLEPWTTEILRGRLIGGAGSELTSDTVGTFASQTTLRSDSGSFLLNGSKFYTTGAPYVDYLRVRAADEHGEPVQAIIPARRDGIEYLDDWDGFGQTHTASGTTRFNGVRVSPDEIWQQDLSEDGEPDRNSLVHLLLHAIAAGILEQVVRDAVTTLTSRRRTYAFAAADQPAHDPQLLQVVGELASAAFVTRSAVLAAGDQLDAASRAKASNANDARQLEEASALAAAKVKVGVEALALKAAGDLFGVGGSSAVWGGKQLDRHWRNLRTLFSHHPTVYKARTIGDTLVNSAGLPRNGFF